MIDLASKIKIFWILTFFVSLKFLIAKTIIADYFVNQFLTNSKFFIPNDSNYHITFWIRIYQWDVIGGTTIIWKMQNDNGHYVSFNLVETNSFSVTDDQNTTQTLNWSIPYQSGLEDIKNDSTFYSTWLPILISQSSLTQLNIFSFEDLDAVSFLNKQFLQTSSSYIDFNPTNDQNKVFVLYENVIYREEEFVQQANLINSYIFNNGYLGLFTQKAHSKNKTIFYNLNRKDEHSQYHIYNNITQPYIFEDENYQSVFDLQLPNFFDSHVFYILQFYQQINLKKFTSQDVLDDGNLYSTELQLYNRYLIGQTKYMSLNFDINFYYVKNKLTHDYLISFLNDQSIITLYSKTGITKTLIIENYVSFDFIMFIQSLPQSSFIKQNEIRFLMKKNYESKYSQFNFEFDQTETVDFIYSKNDLVTQKQQMVNYLSQILSYSFEKIIFYRDTKLSFVENSQKDTSFYFGNNLEVLLYQLQSTGHQHYMNYNPNNMSDLVLYQGISMTSQNSINCFNTVALCQFCINYICLRCNEGYYLVDGKCLICNTNYMQFINECVIEHQKYGITNYDDSNLYYDSQQLQLLIIRNLTTLQGETASPFTLFADDINKVNNMLVQIKNQFDITSIKISVLKTYYVSSFQPYDLSICSNNKLYFVQENLQTLCVDLCPSEYIQQGKFCTKNNRGCNSLNQNGFCNTCLTNYHSEMQNDNNILCFLNNLSSPLQTFMVDFSWGSDTTTLSNCLFQTIDNKCLVCETSYVINQTTYTCDFDFFIAFQEQTLASCTQYKYVFLTLTCVGQLSETYQDVNTPKWNHFCNTASNDTTNDCSSCVDTNQQLNELQNCYECLNFNTITNQCEECQSGYQLRDGNCYQQTCLFYVQNCQDCQAENFVRCGSCLENHELNVVEEVQECQFSIQPPSAQEPVTPPQEQVCSLAETFLEIQQFCIFTINLIDNCYLYDQNQHCIQCQQDFYLEYYIEQEQTRQICLQKQIQNCNLYYKNQLCYNCLQNYFLSVDLQSCIQEVNCSNQICIYEQQQQIQYQQIIDNCLLQVQFCKQCSYQSKNLCSHCQDNFQLNDQKCVVQQLQDSTFDFFLDQYCNQIIQGCKKCKYEQDQYICTQCQVDYLLESNKCQKLQQLVYGVCLYPCIQCVNQVCISCVKNYSNQKGICKSEIVDLMVQCIDYVECFVDGHSINGHCAKCKQECQYQIYINTISFDQNQVLINDSQLQNSLDYRLVVDQVLNKVFVSKKDDFENELQIIIDRDIIIKKSYNCTPKKFYEIKLKNIDFQFKKQIQASVLEFENYLSSIISTLNIDNFKFLFKIVSNIKIFQYLPYINIQKGNYYDNYYNFQRQGLDIKNSQFISQYFSNSYEVKMYIEILQIDLIFFDQLNSIGNEFMFFLIIIFLQNLLLIAGFTRKKYKSFKKRIRRQFKQYLILKIIMLQLTFITYVNSLNYFIEENKTIAFILLLIVSIIGYGIFWTGYKMLRNSRKFKTIFYQKRFHIKKDFLKQKYMHRNYFHVLQSFFLFLKLKILYDCKHYSNLGIVLFIMINLIELFKYRLITQFYYLKVIYIFEVMQNASLIVFMAPQIFSNVYQIDLNVTFLNISFIFCFVMQILTPLLENFISYKRNKMQNAFEQLKTLNFQQQFK